MAVSLACILDIVRAGIRDLSYDYIPMTLYGSNPATTGLGYGSSPRGMGGLGGSSVTAQSTSVVSTTSNTTTIPAHPDTLAAYQGLMQAQQAQFEIAAANMLNSNLYTQAPPGGMIPVTVGSTGEGFLSVTSNTSVTGFSQFGQFGDASAPTATQPSTDAYYRSMDLLYEWLTPEQRKQLAIRRSFDVIGGDTGNRYRLHPPCPYNIHQLCRGSDEIEHKLCFVPKNPHLPSGDIWLCQKLALELDERATLEIANRQTYHGF